MSNEELEKQQQTSIDDIISDFMPPAEPTGEPAAVGGEKPIEQEGATNVEEGQERPAETPSGQEQAGEPKPKEEAPVAPVREQAAPVKEKPPVTPPPEETELEKMKRENLELRAHLEEIAGKVMTPPAPKPLTPQETEARKAEAEKQAKQILRFLPSDEVFDEVMKDTNTFNALLTSVVNTAVERSLRLMPVVATQLVDQQITLKTVVNDFYTDNKDLVPHKKYVGFVANELTAQHPDWTLPQILQGTETEVRNRLRLARVADATAPGAGVVPQTPPAHTPPSNPGFVPGGGSGRRGPSSSDGNLSAQEKDIINLIS